MQKTKTPRRTEASKRCGNQRLAKYMVTSKPIRRSVYAGLVHMGVLLPDGVGVVSYLFGAA